MTTIEGHHRQDRRSWSRTGKVREIADVRDETGPSGLKIAIDLKRGTDPEKLMATLMKMTTLQDTASVTSTC